MDISSLINFDETLLKNLIESATNQGPYCGILNRRSVSYLNPVHHPEREHLLCTGSMVDGTGHAASGLWQIDTDYMEEVLQLVDESKLRHCDKPGFVWIQMEEGESENLFKLDGSYFVCASALRNLTKEQRIDLKGQFENHFKVLSESKTGASTDFWLNLGKDSTLQEYLDSVISPKGEKPSIRKPQLLEPPEDFTYHFDYVRAVHCHSWPQLANKWKERARKIYTSSEVDDLISYGFHLVPKSPPDGNADLDFRLSFSVAEDKIVKGWSDTKWLCYLILKFLQKLRLKEAEKVVTTYHFKTLMMWACEEKHQSVWKEDNITNCILGVIDNLLEAMNERRLAHYFVPEINLFDTVSDESMKQVMKHVESLRTEIETASRKKPGYHWLCQVFHSQCHHPKDQASFEAGEQIAFASLKLSNDTITLQIKEGVVRTVDFHQTGKITDEEYEKRELLMNVFIRMLEEKMEFTNQVTTVTNYELSVPPPTTGNLDPFLLTNPGSDNHDYLMELAKPQLALEKIVKKYFFTTEKSPDDPWNCVTEIVPESVNSFSQTNLLKYKWRTLEELKNAEVIFPFPKDLKSLNEKDKKAWNFICEAAKVSRMSTGVDKEPKDTDRLSAAVLLEHIFWGELNTEKGEKVMNLPCVGGADLKAVIKPLEEIIKSKQFEEDPLD